MFYKKKHGGQNEDKTVENFESALAGFLRQLPGSNERFSYRQEAKHLKRANRQSTENELKALAKIIKAVARSEPDILVSTLGIKTKKGGLEAILDEESEKKFSRTFATLDAFRQNQVFFETVEQISQSNAKFRYHFFHKPFRKFLRWTLGLALLQLVAKQKDFGFVPDFRGVYIGGAGGVKGGTETKKKSIQRDKEQTKEKRERAKITYELSGLGRIMLDDALKYYQNNKKVGEVSGNFGLWVKHEMLYKDYGGQSVNLTKFWEAVDEGKLTMKPLYQLLRENGQNNMDLLESYIRKKV